MMRRGKVSGLLIAALAVAFVAACSSTDDATTPSASSSSAVAAPTPPEADLVNPDAAITRPIRIGVQDVGSARVMAEVYARALQGAGFDVVLTPTGLQADFIEAMSVGAVDLLPAYAGVFANALYAADNNGAEPPVWTDAADAARAVNEIGAASGIEMLGATEANESAAFVVSKEFARTNGVTTLSELAEWSATHPTRMGAESTCETRPYCLPNLVKTYGMQVKEFVPLSTDGSVVKAALLDGSVDFGWLSGSDAATNSADLVVLQEDKPLNIVRNIAPVIQRAIATPEVVATLDAVTATVTEDRLDAMVAAVQDDGEPIGKVASDYIAAQGLGDGLYTGPLDVVGVEVVQELPELVTAPVAGGPLRISFTPLADTEIAARVYAGALTAAGVDVAIDSPMDPADLLAALPSGEVQLTPIRLLTAANYLNTREFGPLTLPIEGRDVGRIVSDARVLADPIGVTVLKPSAANVEDSWTVTKDFVANTGITTLSQLATVSKNRPIVLGGPADCPELSWCKPFLESDYGVKVDRFVPLDFGGGLTRGAIDTGAVDVGWLSGNDGGLTEFDFVTLADDLGRQSVNPITPLANTASLTPEIQKVINRVSAKLTTEELASMIHQVEFERLELTDVVSQFLRRNGLV